MNKVILIGNLTRDPELTTTQSGVSVCKMSIAVNRNYTNAQGERECDFFNIVSWRQQAENCARFLSKGKKVGIVGELQTRHWEDKYGQKRTATEIQASEIEFLSPRDNDGYSEPQAPRSQQGGAYQQQSMYDAPQRKRTADELIPVDDGNLPF